MADIKIKTVEPYDSVPYLELNELETESRHGAHFFRNVKQLQVGFGSQVFRVDRDGMWAGAETFGAAPWKVSWNGDMVASSITLSGYIPTGGALTDIGSGNITETYIDSNAITTAKIAANAISASKIQSNAVTASKINVSELSAITADIGSVTSGTITGALIRTSSSGDRVELDDGDDAIRIYDTAGEKRMELIHDTLNFYNENGVNAGLLYATDTGSYEYLYFDISNNSDGSFLFNIDNTGRIIWSEDGNVKLYYDASTNEFVFWEDIMSDGGIVDIGSSAADFDDIWCDTLHYNTLSLRSDRRLKKNIKPMSYGLTDLMKLSPVSFNYKRKEKVVKEERIDADSKVALSKSKKDVAKLKLDARKSKAKERADHKTAMIHFGLIAQEVHKVMPEITENVDNPDEMASIRYQELTSVMVKAIQELAGKVSTLEDEVDTLRGG